MPNRSRDARALRYTQAKQAAARAAAALEALTKAQTRYKEAGLAFVALCDAAESVEEAAYLRSLDSLAYNSFAKKPAA